MRCLIYKTFDAMAENNVLSTILICLDKYMIDKGKTEIGDIEANMELERAGLLSDSKPNPGKPLREMLKSLRDTNLLPQNIRQKYGSWSIKLSSTIARMPMVNQFQYS